MLGKRVLCFLLIAVMSISMFQLATFAEPLTVITKQVTDITKTSAMVNGNIKYNEGYGITSVKFYYGTSRLKEMTDYVEVTGYNPKGGDISATIKGLKPGTTYDYMPVIENAGGSTVTGDYGSFTTLSDDTGYSVKTKDATEVTITSALLNGYIDKNTVNDIKSIMFLYCDSSYELMSMGAYELIDTCAKVENYDPDVGYVSARITGLKPETTYYYVTAVVDSKGSYTLGNIGSFKTLNGVKAECPSVTTLDAKLMNKSTVLVEGCIFDTGGYNLEFVRFYYGTSEEEVDKMKKYIEVKDYDSPNEDEGVVVSAQIPNLEPGVTYYYNLIAENSEHLIDKGYIKSFKVDGTFEKLYMLNDAIFNKTVPDDKCIYFKLLYNETLSEIWNGNYKLISGRDYELNLNNVDIKEEYLKTLDNGEIKLRLKFSTGIEEFQTLSVVDYLVLYVGDTFGKTGYKDILVTTLAGLPVDRTADLDIEMGYDASAIEIKSVLPGNLFNSDVNFNAKTETPGIIHITVNNAKINKDAWNFADIIFKVKDNVKAGSYPIKFNSVKIADSTKSYEVKSVDGHIDVTTNTYGSYSGVPESITVEKGQIVNLKGKVTLPNNVGWIAVGFPYDYQAYIEKNLDDSINKSNTFDLSQIQIDTVNPKTPMGKDNPLTKPGNYILNVTVISEYEEGGIDFPILVTVNPDSKAAAVTTKEATSIAQTSAILNCYIDKNGGYAITSIKFHYGTSRDNMKPVEVIGYNSTERNISRAITGLKPGTTYYYMPEIKNSQGYSTKGTIGSFTTLSEESAITLTNMSGLTGYQGSAYPMSGVINSKINIDTVTIGVLNQVDCYATKKNIGSTQINLNNFTVDTSNPYTPSSIGGTKYQNPLVNPGTYTLTVWAKTVEGNAVYLGCFNVTVKPSAKITGVSLNGSGVYTTGDTIKVTAAYSDCDRIEFYIPETKEKWTSTLKNKSGSYTQNITLKSTGKFTIQVTGYNEGSTCTPKSVSVIAALTLYDPKDGTAIEGVINKADYPGYVTGTTNVDVYRISYPQPSHPIGEHSTIKAADLQKELKNKIWATGETKIPVYRIDKAEYKHPLGEIDYIKAKELSTRFDSRTWSIDAPPNELNITFGNYDSRVQEAQRNLISLGYDVGDDGADGEWGYNTQSALNFFRTGEMSVRMKVTLKPIAYPDAATLKAINEAAGKETVTPPQGPVNENLPADGTYVDVIAGLQQTQAVMKGGSPYVSFVDFALMLKAYPSPVVEGDIVWYFPHSVTVKYNTNKLINNGEYSSDLLQVCINGESKSLYYFPQKRSDGKFSIMVDASKIAQLAGFSDETFVRKDENGKTTIVIDVGLIDIPDNSTLGSMAVAFLQGFYEGLVQSVKDTWEFIKNPSQMIEGMKFFAKAVVPDSEEQKVLNQIIGKFYDGWIGVTNNERARFAGKALSSILVGLIGDKGCSIALKSLKECAAAGKLVELAAKVADGTLTAEAAAKITKYISEIVDRIKTGASNMLEGIQKIINGDGYYEVITPDGMVLKITDDEIPNSSRRVLDEAAERFKHVIGKFSKCGDNDLIMGLGRYCMPAKTKFKGKIITDFFDTSKSTLKTETIPAMEKCDHIVFVIDDVRFGDVSHINYRPIEGEITNFELYQIKDLYSESDKVIFIDMEGNIYDRKYILDQIDITK